ncbi:uncharacterized protein B0H18DRAFT_1035800 [Fomitopsis serialis]|uniref:uncharacterized protein n=1 Tax=Fomitopsis serialis TaxID=139415 RepID=UPI002007F331|nr:uncharacterized protein B0H18DRAFT_1035800 [Neoantrodia serialis]KAH9917185.1 hypothetical protein B0H18DRAFT_1035800 [Neoantrodia serialis]
MEGQAVEKSTASDPEGSSLALLAAEAEAPQAAPPTKKARHHAFAKRATIERPPCRLAGMPLEILAEILSYASTPATVLALARCSKYFCHTLVNNPSTTFIWRNARARCRLDRYVIRELPEPLHNFTESSYAAFVFDGGKCEVCGKHTRRMYESFCLRARVCDKPTCKSNWSQDNLIEVGRADHPRYKDLVSWIPRMETQGLAEARIRVRRRDWDAAVDELNRALLEPDTMEQFLAKKRALSDRLATTSKWAGELTGFKHAWELQARTVKEANEARANICAIDEGWTAFELIGTPTYGLLHRSKTASLEMIIAADFNLIRDQVDKEVAERRERAIRRKAEGAYEKRRGDVAEHYSRLKSAPEAKETLPTLPEFRRLSVMKVLQGKPTDPDEGVAKDLKNSKLLNELLSDSLRQWREDARSALAGVLGFAGWKSASKNKLHPVDRLTARFMCKKCVSRGKGGEDLDFAAACEHRCAGLNKRQRARETWNANLFEPDTKAIDAANKVLALLQTAGEDPESKTRAEMIGPKFLCTACPVPIAMTLDSAIRHSKRHESFTLTFTGEGDSRLDVYKSFPIPTGLTARLMGQGDDAREERSQKVYGCRHCQQTARQAISPTEEREPTAATSVAPDARSSEASARKPESQILRAEGVDGSAGSSTAVAGNQPQTAPPAGVPATDSNKIERLARKLAKEKLYSFDGLRSHLKQKHGVVNVRDEDVYAAPSSA